MSGYDDNDLAAIDRLEDLLEAYCDARLAPRSAVLARIRKNVLAEAAAAAAVSAAPTQLRLVEPQRAFPRWSPPRFARAFAGLGFAAALTLGTTAAVLAAPPGSPFYNARVYLETLVLPTQVDALVARHTELLAERWADVQAALERDDSGAVAAALATYRDEVTAATQEIGGDASRLAHLEEELSKHTAVLTALAETLPEQSSIDNAIEASSKAIAKLQARTHPLHPTHPPQGGGGGGQGGSNGNGSDNQASGSEEPDSSSPAAPDNQNQGGGQQ